jgi:hypothetical protein
MPWLLSIYTTWYLGLSLFILRGDLGFFGVLPGTGLSRFEFRSGFTATELPIYVGLQIPIMVYAVLVGSGALRIWAWALLGCALAIVVASVSFGALTATALVALVFVSAYRGMSWSAMLRSALMLVGVLVCALILGGSLIDSVREKIQSFAFGEGVRALLYAELIADIIENPWLGIGKGRFVETNNFSSLGDGVFPHQNLLGVGAELGVPALLLFGGFLLAGIVSLGRASLDRSSRQNEQLRLLVTAVLAVFVYQQFRGLFQDTWVIRETYVWLGVAGGIISVRPRGIAESSPRQ